MFVDELFVIIKDSLFLFMSFVISAMRFVVFVICNDMIVIFNDMLCFCVFFCDC